MTDDCSLDQAEINAVEVESAGKELRRERVYCPRCKVAKRKPGLLVRYYKCPDVESGEPRLWVWVPPMDLGWTKIPARCANVAERVGEIAITQHTQCGRCRDWWVVFPGGQSRDDLRAMEGKTLAMTHRPRASFREPARAGDRTVVGIVTSDVIEGPRGVMLLRVDGSTWGQISE